MISKLLCGGLVLCGFINSIPAQTPSKIEVKSDPLNDVIKPLPATQAKIVARSFSKQITSDGDRRLIYYNELVADGHFERAIQYLADFLVIYPLHYRRFEAQNLLAQAQLNNGHTIDAVNSFIAAWQIAPDEARGLESYLQAGQILADLGQQKQASKIFKDVMRIRPSSSLSNRAQTAIESYPKESNGFESDVNNTGLTLDQSDPNINRAKLNNNEIPLIRASEAQDSIIKNKGSIKNQEVNQGNKKSVNGLGQNSNYKKNHSNAQQNKNKLLNKSQQNSKLNQYTKNSEMDNDNKNSSYSHNMVGEGIE